MTKVKRIDYGGCVISIAAATSFIMGISWGGVQYPWSSWRTIVPIVFGLLGCIAFFFYEEYVPVEPIVPTTVFKNLTCAVSYINTIIHGIVVIALVFYLPLYYEGVKGFSTTITGVALFPETFTVAPAAVIIGIVVGKVGVYRWAGWSGWTISMLGLGILYLLDVNTTTVQWVFLNLVAGIGTGFLYPAHQFGIQAATSDKDLAAAVSMWSFTRSVGQTLGVAVGGVILQNQLLQKLRAYPNLAAKGAEYSHNAVALASLLRDMPDTPDRADLKQAYADSLKVVFAVMCGLCGVGLLLSLLVKDYSLDRFVPPVPATGGEGSPRSASESEISEKQAFETKREPV